MTAQAGSAALSSSSFDRESVRREMRARRRALSANDRQAAQKRFVAIAQRSGLLKPEQKVGLYLAYGAEADPSTLLNRARQLRCTVFLPIISDYRSSRMRFVPFDARDKLICNRFGIPEPTARRFDSADVRHLDVIFVPLVAVDENGNRIGSGAGFYDRALKHLRRGRRWRRPKLIGLAFECQRVKHIPAERWDVPLDALLTEKNFYRFTPQDLRQGDV
jgi:5-formyltetrahydrofolate cyclo-ligase